MSGQLNSSVLTAFSILELLSESRPVVTAQDVSRELGLNAVTAYRFLRSLEVAGALVAVQRGQYRLGLRLSDLGERATATNAMVGLIQPHLNDIAETLQETALATMYRHGRTVIVARALAPRPYSMHMHVGAELELHCTANGKLWLASLDEAELERYLSRSDRKRFSAHTIVEADALRREVARARESGFAMCVKEREEEISALGVPVLTRRGRMIAGISIFGPNSRFTEAFIHRARDVLSLAARKIQAALYGGAADEEPPPA